LCTAASSHSRYKVSTVVDSTYEVRVTSIVPMRCTVTLTILTRSFRAAVLQVRGIVCRRIDGLITVILRGAGGRQEMEEEQGESNCLHS